MSADLLALIEPLQPYAQALVNVAGQNRLQPRVTSTLRSHSEQKRLYAAFLRGQSRYPVAVPGTSPHEYGFAFDMVASTREALHALGNLWRSWGGLWGPNDEIHFEYPGFVVPPPEERLDGENFVPGLTSVCDSIVKMSPLGVVALAEQIADVVTPLDCAHDPSRVECQIQAYLQGPCSYLLK